MFEFLIGFDVKCFFIMFNRLIILIVVDYFDVVFWWWKML